MVINYFIDFSFLLDIFINFRTIILDAQGEEVVDPKVIAIEYIKGNFVLDVLATIPFEIFVSNDQ